MMISKLIITLLLLSIYCVQGFTQQKYTISGQVKDISQESVAGAEVQLTQVSDSSVVQRKITRDNGKFTFSGFPAGKYLIKIEATGQQQYISAVFQIDEQQTAINLPLIVLTPIQQKNMKEVVVIAKKPLIEQDIDKTTVNVEAMISAATSNVLEVLEKTPGVAVNSDGEITLNQKSGVLVLIEGRQTYLSVADLASYLRSIPGASIDKIELMTNPPARYDAAGGAIINIKFKKNKKAGFIGNLSTGYSQGISNRVFSSLNLNYNTKKFSIFSNISGNDDKNFGDDQYDRTYYDDSKITTSTARLSNYITEWMNDVNGRIGLDYSISQKTSFGVQFSGFSRKKKDEMNYSNVFNPLSAGEEIQAYGTNKSRYTNSQHAANANFLHKFSDNGTELTADFNYINYQNTGRQVLENYIVKPNVNPDSNYLFTYNMPGQLKVFAGNMDYNHVLKNKLTLSAGAKTSFITNDNTTDYYDIENNTANIDWSKSNRFIYKENINALYANAKKDWKKIGAQVGLRMENTQTEGHQVGNAAIPENRLKRQYTDLFPSVFLRYSPDSLKKHNITVSSAYRINRPGYQQLNPFLIFIDQFNYRTGNPYLRPSYTTVMELNYSYKQWFRYSIGYDRANDAYFNATQNIDSIFTSRPENAAKRRMISMAANFQVPVKKWWRTNLMVIVANFKTEGKIYGTDLSQNINAFRIQNMHMFTISKSWSAELSGRYTHGIIDLQRALAPRWYVNAAVQKKVMKGKGTFKLSVDDIFYSLKYAETRYTNNAEAYHVEIHDTRRVGLSFNFNFGKDSFNRKKRNVDGADDVKGRVE
jgi:hypothetical protein